MLAVHTSTRFITKVLCLATNIGLLKCLLLQLVWHQLCQAFLTCCVTKAMPIHSINGKCCIKKLKSCRKGLISYPGTFNVSAINTLGGRPWRWTHTQTHRHRHRCTHTHTHTHTCARMHKNFPGKSNFKKGDLKVHELSKDRAPLRIVLPYLASE